MYTVYIYILQYIYIIQCIYIYIPHIFLEQHQGKTSGASQDAVEFGEAEVVGGNFKAGFRSFFRQKWWVFPWKMGIYWRFIHGE